MKTYEKCWADFHRGKRIGSPNPERLRTGGLLEASRPLFAEVIFSTAQQTGNTQKHPETRWKWAAILINYNCCLQT